MAPVIQVDHDRQRFAGTQQPSPDILLLHTTEVWAWPGYEGGKTAPHVTIKPLPKKGIEVRVHRPWTDYGKSLANSPGGVETNRRGVIQIELMGTCDPRRKGLYLWPEADDVVLKALADYLRPVMDRFNIPAKALGEFVAYPASYGRRARQRLSNSEWNRGRGICGHQHAPENDHGDPGAFPIDRFIAFLQEDDMFDDDARRTLNALAKDVEVIRGFSSKTLNFLNWRLDDVLAEENQKAVESIAVAVAEVAKSGEPVDQKRIEEAVRTALASLATKSTD